MLPHPFYSWLAVESPLLRRSLSSKGGALHRHTQAHQWETACKKTPIQEDLQLALNINRDQLFEVTVIS